MYTCTQSQMHTHIYTHTETCAHTRRDSYVVISQLFYSRPGKFVLSYIPKLSAIGNNPVLWTYTVLNIFINNSLRKTTFWDSKTMMIYNSLVRARKITVLLAYFYQQARHLEFRNITIFKRKVFKNLKFLDNCPLLLINEYCNFLLKDI